MARAEIHAELRATRPWVLLMGSVALALLGFWSLFNAAAWAFGAMPSDPANPAMDALVRTFFIQLHVAVLGALVPFANLLRFGLALGSLREEEPATLRRALELNRTFWRQAEWLMWATAWLMAYPIVAGLLFGVIG